MMKRFTRPTFALIISSISLVGIFSLFLLPSKLSAQAGQCNGGGCAGPGAGFGGAQTTVSNTFVNSVGGTWAGEYNTYNVTAGQQYEWSLCTVDGAVASGDKQLTLKTTGNVNICYSDDRCGLLPKILWTATFTGQVRVLINQYSCVTNTSSHTVRWRCVTCTLNCSGTPNSGTISVPSTSVCSGSNFTMTNTGASSGGGITYQWQSSPNNLTWTNITGANSLSYTTSTTSTMYYRMVVTCSNSGISTVSNVLTITPTACCTYTFNLTDSWGDGWNGNYINLRIGGTVVATIGTGFTFGTTFTQTVQVISGTTYNLQWISGSWVSECGYNLRDQNNTIVHSFPTGGAPGNGVQFFTFTPSCVTNPTDPTGVTASANPICAGSTVQLSASGASGTVYWYSGSCGGTLVGTGNPITVSPGGNTTYFARNFNGTSYSINCASLAITVESAITNNTISASQTLCSNVTPSSFIGSGPLGGSGVYTYAWESSTDNASWVSITGSNSQNYTSGTVSTNTYFRRIVSGGACAANTSTSIWIQSQAVLTPSVSISANPSTTICAGTNVTFTATPTNGGTTPAYQWSINGGPVGSNSSTFTTNTLTNGNIVQVTLTSNAPCVSPTSVVSNSLTIQVNPIPPTPTIITNSPLCQGNTLSLSTTPTAFASYAWTGPAGYTSSSLINSIPNVGSNRSGVYSLVITVSGCPSPVGTATVLVTDSVGSQSISSAQTLCSGSTPSMLTGANPTGGTGIYTYTWDSSSDNVNWSALPGETNQTLNPPVLSTTVYYRRMVGSGLCPGNSSNSLAITIEQPLGNNSLTSAQTICSGDVPASLTGSNPTGGSGSYTFVWGSSTNNTTWSVVPGANQIDYAPGSMVSTIYYRRIISGGVCPASTSQDIQIWVDPVLTSNTVQSDQTICAGNSPASFTGSLPGGGNGVFNYQWESSTDNSSWNLVTGGTGQNYTEGVLNSDTYYRRIVVSGPCTSISASIAVRVEQSIQGNTIIHSQTICANTNPMEISGSIPSGGNGLFVYIWESSSNTLSWSVILGATSQNYQPGFPPSTAYYRRIVQGGVCLGSPSNVVLLLVEPVITNNTVLGSQTLCATQTSQQLTGSLPLGGSGVYSYLWESSTDNSSWGVITGYTNQSLVGQVMTSSTYYRRIVMGGACVPSSSASASVMVMPQLTGNTVLGDQTICSGNVAMMLSGGIPSGGVGSYSYQWEESLNNILFTTIGGAINQNYSPGLLGSSRYFRRVLSSGPCTDVSNTVLVIVDNLIGTNTIGSSQTICVGVVPSLLTGSIPSGGNGIYSYQWESSSNNSSWGTLTGETQLDYQAGISSTTVWYRRVINAGVCTPSTSSGIRVLVNPVPTASLSGAHTICMGSSAQLTAMLTGVGPWDLAWSDGMSTQTIVGINSTPHLFSVTPGSSTTYTLSNVMATCNGTLSGSATVTVNAMPTATISGANTICTGGSTALSVSFTGTGPWDLGYQDGVSPVVVNGITSNPYIFSVTPSSTRNYTLSSIFATCSGLVSGSVTVVVNPIPTAMLTGNQTICTGSNANLTLLLSGGAPWDVVLSDGTNTYPFNGINSSPFTAITSPLANTSYTVQSVFATCNGNTAGSSSVVVNPVPTASISGGQTICNNYGTTLTFNLSGVGPWSVNYTDGVSPFNINGITNPVHVITVSPSVSRTYTLTSVFATCNGSVSGSAAIGVTNPPFAFMTGNRTICQGDNSTVQIGLSGFGPWNITYSTGSGNITITGITSSPYQFNITPTATSYFSMVNVNSNCPGTAAGNATIVLNPVPTASFVSSYLPVCTGQGRQVQVNLTGVQPWSITYTDGVTPVTLTGITSSPYTFTVNPVTPETYTLTNVNATCNGTFGNASVLVQPEAAPTATLSGTQTVCMLTPATLSVNFTGTGPWDIVYTDGANNFGVNGLTANPATFTVNMGAVQKTINLVSVTGACSGLVSGTAVIDITSKPVAVMSAPAGMCLGIGGQLSVSISGLGPWDLTYTDGTNFYTENAIASSPYSWTVNPTENTTYQLTNVVSPYCTGSVLSTPISVPVSIQPTASLTGAQTICSGNVANLSLSLTGQAPWTAVYSNGTNSFVLNGLSADTVISLMPMVTTTYTLSSVSTKGCSGIVTGNEEVTVIPNVSASYAGSDQTICSNTFTLSGNIPGVGTGEWKVLQGTGTLSDSSLYNASVGNLSVGTNVLVWEISSGICVSTSQIMLEVMVPPTTANAGTDQYLCGTSTVMNANTPVNGTGTWTVLSGMGTLVDPNDANSPVNNLLLGHTVLQWTIVGGGCTSSSIVNVYAALSAPASSAGQDQLICNSTTTLNAMTPTIGTGMWVRASGSGSIQDTLDAQSPVNGLSLGLNTFVWITQNAGCYATDSVQIQVVQAPVADFIYTQFGFDIDFADVSQGGAGSYSWTFGDGGTSLEQNPHHTYMQAGVYPVRLIITNVCRSDTAYDTIRIGGVKNNDFADNAIGIELYPNPASSGYVELKVNGIYGDQVTVRIYNMLGAEVLTREIFTEGRDSFTQRIELGTLLSKGTYTVILETEKGIKSEKLVVL